MLLLVWIRVTSDPALTTMILWLFFGRDESCNWVGVQADVGHKGRVCEMKRVLWQERRKRKEMTPNKSGVLPTPGTCDGERTRRYSISHQLNTQRAMLCLFWKVEKYLIRQGRRRARLIHIVRLFVGRGDRRRPRKEKKKQNETDRSSCPFDRS